MRKIVFFLGIFWLLAGCAPAADSTPTAQPISALAIVTPQVGAVTVLSVPGKVLLFLRAQPDASAASTGEVKPGDTGKVLGVDASGAWMLVEIKQQTGWLPIQYLDYTIAQ